MNKSYRAYATGANVTAATPRKAAELFFAQYPTKRKCTIVEGAQDGTFFTVSYGRASCGEWPKHYDNVTKRTIADLPDDAPTQEDAPC